MVLGILLPWDKLGDLRVSLLGVGEDLASLKVYSLGGDMDIFIDGEQKGTVLETESYLEIFPVNVGEHNVVLKRKASLDGFYEEFRRNILFEKGFDVVISWEIGPTDESSSGWLLYAQQVSTDSEEIPVNIRCTPEDCMLLVDEKTEDSILTEGLTLNVNSQHSVKATKEGYQDLDFLLFPEEDVARQRLKGYELFLEINLYQIPLY